MPSFACATLPNRARQSVTQSLPKIRRRACYTSFLTAAFTRPVRCEHRTVPGELAPLQYQSGVNPPALRKRRGASVMLAGKPRDRGTMRGTPATSGTSGTRLLGTNRKLPFFHGRASLGSLRSLESLACPFVPHAPPDGCMGNMGVMGGLGIMGRRRGLLTTHRPTRRPAASAPGIPAPRRVTVGPTVHCPTARPSTAFSSAPAAPARRAAAGPGCRVRERNAGAGCSR